MTHNGEREGKNGAPEAIDHLDVSRRVAKGRAARKAVPRSSHEVWDPSAPRRDPVGLLLDQETIRLPELVPIRHERMLASPFAFYRGAAMVMASDLAAAPQSGLGVQCCGDAHLVNFGGFASPSRELLFDLNDFDETNPGPFEWDVKRLAASFEIACRAREFSSKSARGIVANTVRAYREAMREFAGMTNFDVWYSKLDVSAILARWRSRVAPAEAKRFEGIVARAQSKDSLKAFAKLTRLVDGQVRISSDPPFIMPLADLVTGWDPEELRHWIHQRIRTYRRSLQGDRRHLLESYEFVDAAHKVVGVGSVGTRCWIVLLRGRDDGDPLFLQLKEAQPSVLEPYSTKSRYVNRGQRVVEGQRLMQAASDIMLGWTRIEGLDGVERDFYVRQLWDWKLSPNVERMSTEIMTVYGEMCGWTLARAHARSGDRIALAAYLGGSTVFDEALATFVSSYADQNERDFESMAAAAAEGRVSVPSRDAGPEKVTATR